MKRIISLISLLFIFLQPVGFLLAQELPQEPEPEPELPVEEFTEEGLPEEELPEEEVVAEEPEEEDIIIEDVPEEEVEEESLEEEPVGEPEEEPDGESEEESEEEPEEESPDEEEISVEDINEPQEGAEPEPEPPVEEPELILPLIYINEILPDPLEDDALNEWIELYNAGDEIVDMTGWHLDDARLDDGQEYVFSEEFLATGLLPGDYTVLTRPETGLTLNNDFDSLTLFDAEGNIIDFFEFESPRAGRSLGRNPDNIDEWLVYSVPTPGEENIIVNDPPVAIIEIQKDTAYMKLNLTGASSYDPDGDKLTFLWEYEEGIFDERENPLIYEYSVPGEKSVKLIVTDEFGKTAEATIIFNAQSKVSAGGGGGSAPVSVSYPSYSFINEIMPSPAGKDDENEWIELFNATSVGADLSGWYLDDDEGKSSPYKIPAGTVLDGGQYLVFYAPDLKLSLANAEDRVRLLNPNKQVSQSIYYCEAPEDYTFARDETGQFLWTPLVTQGYRNDFPPPPKAYLKEVLVFESVLPNPEGEDSGNEKIMLKNMGRELIDLAGWRLEDGQGHVRELASMSVPVGRTVTLGSADFKFSLNNSDEKLLLYDPVGNLIDQISWKDSSSGIWLFNSDSLTDGLLAQVVRVVDGDTFVAEWENRKLVVRLIGVDTPETVHPFKPVEYYGRQASDFLKKTLENQTVRFEFETDKIDKYGRLLAYVYLDDFFVNAEIIKQGYGYAYVRFPFRYLDDFVSYEVQAKESKLGIWQNQKVRSLMELAAEEAEELTSEEMEEMLLEFEEELPEEIPEETEEELPAEEEIPVEEVLPAEDCRSEFLKIDSFLPNAEKGFSSEYIRLKNEGTETVCFSGWLLDDIPDGGSKPFVIRGGSIAPDAVRTFRKQETGLALNNKDDCVTLSDQDGRVVDQICYGATHKNEIFTHEGGDWVPKKKVTKTSSKTSSSAHFSFKRDILAYSSELPSITYTGRVKNFDEAAGVLFFETLEGENFRVVYAHSSFDAETSRSLIDFSEPVEVKVYESGENRHLVSLKPVEKTDEEIGYSSGRLIYFLILLFIIPVVIFLKYR